MTTLYGEALRSQATPSRLLSRLRPPWASKNRCASAWLTNWLQVGGAPGFGIETTVNGSDWTGDALPAASTALTASRWRPSGKLAEYGDWQGCAAAPSRAQR